jgi:hypothetical protein
MCRQGPLQVIIEIVIADIIYPKSTGVGALRNRAAKTSIHERAINSLTGSRGAAVFATSHAAEKRFQLVYKIGRFDDGST